MNDPFYKQRIRIIHHLMKTYGIDHIHHTFISLRDIEYYINEMQPLSCFDLSKITVKKGIKNSEKYFDDIELMESDNGTEFLMMRR